MNDPIYGELSAPCRCVYPEVCFCTPAQKEARVFEFNSISPRGHYLVECGLTKLPLGLRVRVGKHPLESKETFGFEGTLLGFTATHGYAAVHDTEGDKLLLIHPEALEAAPRRHERHEQDHSSNDLEGARHAAEPPPWEDDNDIPL